MADFNIDIQGINPDPDLGEGVDTNETEPLLPTPGVSETLPPGATGISEELPTGAREKLLRGAVNDYYNALADQGFTPSRGRDYNKFELVDGQLRLKDYPDPIVNSRTGAPLAFSTVASRQGGSKAIREDLGFDSW